MRHGTAAVTCNRSTVVIAAAISSPTMMVATVLAIVIIIIPPPALSPAPCAQQAPDQEGGDQRDNQGRCGAETVHDVEHRRAVPGASTFLGWPAPPQILQDGQDTEIWFSRFGDEIPNAGALVAAVTQHVQQHNIKVLDRRGQTEARHL